MATRKTVVKLTSRFEQNLGEIEAFLAQMDAPRQFDALLDELTDTVIPNLQRFPRAGRSFLDRPTYSLEAANGVAKLSEQLRQIGPDGDLREYPMSHYLVLYAHVGSAVYLLSIRHQRQISFDFPALWNT